MIKDDGPTLIRSPGLGCLDTRPLPLSNEVDEIDNRLQLCTTIARPTRDLLFAYDLAARFFQLGCLDVC